MAVSCSVAMLPRQLACFSSSRLGFQSSSICAQGFPPSSVTFKRFRHAKSTILAAWTRRSKGEEPKKNKKTWRERSEKYLMPFSLDIHISSKFVSAKVVHRVTSKVVSVATTNAKDLRTTLHCCNDVNACRVVGQLIAERSKEADVFAVLHELKKGQKYEGKVAAVVETMMEHGVALHKS
eukprot:jgi/Mesen1/2361/ME000156S01502